MQLKKIILLTITVVCLLMISAVNAAYIDVNDTQTVSAIDNDEIVSVENDLNVLSADESTYSDLRDEINAGGINISLAKSNYRYVAGDGDTIEIGNSCVVDGNGAVIDMAGSEIQALKVTTSGVTIRNLTIKNTNYNGNGGAIYFDGEGAVINCNFTNNKATNDGGAVYFFEEGSVSNCNFADNKVTGYDSHGGAIYFEGYFYSDCAVTNCNFTNNKATGDGSAIYFRMEGTVSNCNFVDNSAEYGGAIYFYGTGEATNCNFTNNSAENGGAIFGNGAVTNCNFANNTAEYGGAIYSQVYSTYAATNCNFANNTAKNGGAIYLDGDGVVTNCNFTNNKATNDGGAVYFFGDGSVANCTFANNAAYEGGAIYADGIWNLDYTFYNYNVNVSNCNFVNNFATYAGGAIWFSSNYTVNCNFTHNIAYDGGAIYFNHGGTVKNSNFVDNHAWQCGGAMYKGTAVNCKFTGNVADVEGNEIYGDNAKIIASPNKVTYKAGTYYKITVYGESGKLTKNTQVVIKIDGKLFKTLKTNRGIAKFKVTKTPGTYKLTISALGKTVTKTLTVKHLVTLKSATVKKSAKLVLTATLGKLNGKYLSKKTVAFKFNGKTYNAKTDKKGVAKVTIKSSVLKKLKVGKKVTYQATYLKDTVKKTVSVKK